MTFLNKRLNYKDFLTFLYDSIQNMGEKKEKTKEKEKVKKHEIKKENKYFIEGRNPNNVLSTSIDYLLSKPVGILELTVRAKTALEKERIETMGDLLAKTEKDLLCIPGCGQGTICDIRWALSLMNLQLKKGL